MMEHTQMAASARDRFLQAAQKELAAFERREREFIKADRKERAAELQIPTSGGQGAKTPPQSVVKN